MDIASVLEKIREDINNDPDLAFIGGIFDSFKDADAYLVGGMVRDLLFGRESYDHDLVICHVPAAELEKLLEKYGKVNLVGKSFGVFKFMPEGREDGNFIDIALPRTEESWGTGGYKDFDVQSDPDLSIEDDLSRRDLTINAMAVNLKTGDLIDPFRGIKDLKEGIIRTVGRPEDRFREDRTRMLRAARFAAQLGFKIEEATYRAIKKNAANIEEAAADLKRDEFNKLIMSADARKGVMLLHNLGLLGHLIWELEKGVGVAQNKNHIYTVFDHGLRSLDYAAKNGFSLEIRLAALLHDIAKPVTKQGEGPDATFYDHDIVGAKVVRKILKRLNYPNDVVDKVSHLVRYHMFYYSMGDITDAGVRRFIARVGKEHIDDLIKLRMADRIGMGRPKAKPYKLVELEKRVKLVQLDPISVKMLKVNGEDLMKELGLKPGPKFGLILNALLGEVLEDPKKNEREYLLKRMKEMSKMKKEELEALRPNLDEYESERKREFLKNEFGKE